MTNLKEITGINKYCGPAVISAMTGLSTDECVAAIQSVTGQKSDIKAVHMDALIRTFKKLRFDVTKIQVLASTLYGTLSSLTERDGMYIITVPRHVVAVEIKQGNIYFIDNHTKQPIDARGSARLSQMVDSVYHVTAKALPVFIRNEIMIDKFSNEIVIKSYARFQNPDDNLTTVLGRFRFKDEEQLESILYRLHCMYEGKY